MDALKQYLSEERGRGARLAEALRISQPAISMWPRVPAERVLDVERETGIPRTQLRPDLYPAEPARAAS